jgi:DNA invertase Pin-like site-specific DNA recombinase
MTCTVFVWVLVLLALPIVVLLWATESKQTRIRRLRRNGATWSKIAQRYGVSATTARRWAQS